MNDNPARVLYEHLRAIRSATADRKKVLEVLSSVLRLEAGDEVGARRALILVDELFPEIEERLDAIVGLEPKEYTRHFDKLRKGLANLSLSSSSAGAFNFITEEALESSRLCAARLAEVTPIEGIGDADVDELSSRIDGLADWANTADVDPLLRDFALDVCETLRRATFEFRVRGVTGLERAIDEALGSFVRFYGKNREKASWERMRPIWTVIVYAEGVLARAFTYGPVLSEGLSRLLGSGI